MENEKDMEHIKNILKNFGKQTVVIRTSTEDFVGEIKEIDDTTVTIKNYDVYKRVQNKHIKIQDIKDVKGLSGFDKLI